MSKMGISCASSYRCARLFEVVGLNSQIVGLRFPGITSRVEGASFADLHDQSCAMRKRAWQRSKEVDAGGLLKFKPQGEYHAYNPEVVNTLQAAVNSGDYRPIPPLRRCGQQAPRGHHPRYAARENRRAHTDFVLDQVEPAENLYKRFDSAAMSIGALSPEAHEALAVAMNRLGGYSNSGEGGEDPKRYGTESVAHQASGFRPLRRDRRLSDERRCDSD